jgi:hypothetical protein
MLLREQEAVAALQVQFVPAIPVRVKPLGSTSVTVTALPSVGTEPTFETTIVYDPVWPCANVPVCDFAIARAGRTGSLTTIRLEVPVIPELAVSVAVIVMLPAVFRAAENV